MKRERSDFEESIKNLDIAKCLMILAQTSMVKQIGLNQNQHTDSHMSNRFECKTCNRRFSSFQALGGHRASHKKPKLTTVEQNEVKHLSNNYKGNNHLHECSICGQRFGTGQALGGHMRRHRSSMKVQPSFICPVVPTMPVLKRCSSSKRVLSLDLNLTPLENDLEYIFGKTFVPKIDMKFVL
ncbi:PREDICTED: zinc finger protein ZAT11-like [Camelina sativa]|uniref:Zinc finger protein ZAT11-like n=1 Tax=Camelina sativa TaxID=90675 RepID=A0ABM0ZKH4_CAMSA|nr:PREDICTED: zinc finger protein ZAT11-like [Camelina sativa]